MPFIKREWRIAYDEFRVRITTVKLLHKSLRITSNNVYGLCLCGMSYSQCQLANTWGIIEACHFKPTNVYASYTKMKSYPPFNALVQAVKAGHITMPVIFCHPVAAKEFIHRYLRHIDFKFVLVTSHYDSDMPTGALANYEASVLVSNPNLERWFTQNCVVNHPKITPIPIGLDYHTIANSNPSTGHMWGRRESPLEQDTTLLVLRSQMTPIETRIPKCYSTCHMFIGRGHGQDRIDAMNQVPSSLLHLEKERVPRETSWKNQMQYAFVLSPHGNGLDCHRTWEALALGCIPVVKTSPLDRLYEGLPVLIVKRWSDITYEVLMTAVKELGPLCTPEHIPEKLTLNYWTKLIREGTTLNQAT